MNTIISEHDVSRLASLARLRLDTTELHTITSELESILEYVRQLQQVDISTAKTFSDQYAQAAVLRPDLAKPWAVEQLLAGVNTEQGLLVVKNIFDRHES